MTGATWATKSMMAEVCIPARCEGESVSWHPLACPCCSGRRWHLQGDRSTCQLAHRLAGRCIGCGLWRTFKNLPEVALAHKSRVQACGCSNPLNHCLYDQDRLEVARAPDACMSSRMSEVLTHNGHGHGSSAQATIGSANLTLPLRASAHRTRPRGGRLQRACRTSTRKLGMPYTLSHTPMKEKMSVALLLM